MTAVWLCAVGSTTWCSHTHSSAQRLWPAVCMDCRARQAANSLLTLSRHWELWFSPFNPLIATLKPQSNGPSYSNTVIGTLAVDGWAVTFGTVRRGLGGPESAQASPHCTKCNSSPINGQCWWSGENGGRGKPGNFAGSRRKMVCIVWVMWLLCVYCCSVWCVNEVNNELQIGKNTKLKCWHIQCMYRTKCWWKEVGVGGGRAD